MELTHVNGNGEARMVDVGHKPITTRTAVAVGRVFVQPETLRLIAENGMKKGDVLATARIAGIMAAKKTAELIPLCHSLPLTSVSVDLRWIRPTAGWRSPPPPAAITRPGWRWRH